MATQFVIKNFSIKINMTKKSSPPCSLMAVGSFCAPGFPVAADNCWTRRVTLPDAETGLPAARGGVLLGRGLAEGLWMGVTT